MKRLFHTLTAFLCLLGVYRLYAAWVTPLATIREIAAPPTAESAAPAQPPELLREAIADLPQQDWAATARYMWQHSKEAFIYFDERERIEDAEKNKIRVKPFALVWRNPKRPEDDPYVVSCESARVEFANAVELTLDGSDPGRLTGAALEGAVTIRGPNGLRLTGREFVFREDTHQLYSDYPVEFAYGPRPEDANAVAGSADLLRLDLVPSSESALGEDMPLVSGVAGVELLQRIRLSFRFEQEGEPATANVTCAGSFRYDVANHIATFADKVEVERPTETRDGITQFDRLLCEQLGLLFEEAPKSPAGAVSPEAVIPAGHDAAAPDEHDGAPEASLVAGLTLSRVRATGNRARLTSDENRLTAQFQDLRYDAKERGLTLLDEQLVDVQRDGARLLCPLITLSHDETGQVTLARCQGAGYLDYADVERPDLQIRSTWKQQLQMTPQAATGLTVVQISGEARIIQPGKTGISADLLTFWLDAEAARSAQTPAGTRAPARQRPGGKGGLPLRRVRAEGHVAMAGPEFEIETERLEATFQEGRLPVSGFERPGENVPHGNAAGDTAPPPPAMIWRVTSDHIEATLVQDPLSGEVGVARVYGEGAVDIQHLPPPGAAAGEHEPLRITGVRLEVTNEGGDRQTLALKGAPAVLLHPQARLQGPLITFHRSANRATVDGAGVLQLPVDRDLGGKPLEQPGVLNVEWVERMTFDGSEASFLRKVHASVNDAHLHCEDLAVSLAERLSFSEVGGDRPPPEIRQIRCRDAVHGDFLEFHENELVGIRRMELAELIYHHDSGDFQGRGPGRIQDWQRGGHQRAAIAPHIEAQANAPAAPDTVEWSYSDIQFKGDLTGNRDRRVATIKDRVSILHAPVPQGRDTFRRDDLSSDSKQAADAVWLGCNELWLTLHRLEEQTTDFVQVVAKGNAELEGQKFRAVAPTISFDQASDLFRMQAQGNNLAAIHYFERIGDPSISHTAQVIEFVPSRRRLTLDGSRGVQLSR